MTHFTLRINFCISAQTSACELQYAGIQIIDHEVCQNTQTGNYFKQTYGKELLSTQLCAGHLDGGADSCQVGNHVKIKQ